MGTLSATFALVLAMGASATPGEWNVSDFGAAGDGQTDDAAAFQKALDAAAAAGGGAVRVAAGHYRINGTLSIPGAVTLEGTFRVPPTDQREERPKLDGSVLLAYAGRGTQDGPPFIRLAGSMATLSGFIITYPEWSPAQVPPVPYPPTVCAEGNANVAVLDCCFLNSYEAIHFQDTGRFLVRNVYGFPSFRGLYVDACYDIGRVENCHFWPFGIKPADKEYLLWVNLNGVAFEFARTDWQYVVNTFCFGYGVGYKFSKTKNGSCNGNFVGIGADCCERAVLVDTVPGALDLLITNGEFVGRWMGVHAVGVEIAGDSTQRVSLNNCAFWGPLDRAVWAKAPEARLTVNACGFSDWDIAARDAPAIQMDEGRAIVQGNTFTKEGVHVRIGEAVQTALVLGNDAPIGLCVENQAGARTQMTANTADTMTWPPKAKRHYQIDFGATGDSRYVRGFHSKELARPWNGEGTMRWGGVHPRLLLPIQPKTPYQLSIDLYVPEQAIDCATPKLSLGVAPADVGNGIYLAEQRLAELPNTPGVAVITVAIPPQKTDMLDLTIRAKAWVAKAQGADIQNARPLSIGVRRVTMKANRAADRLFDADAGQWVEPVQQGQDGAAAK